MTTYYQVVIVCDLCEVKAIADFLDHADDAHDNLMLKLVERGWVEAGEYWEDRALCPVCKTKVNPDGSVSSVSLSEISGPGGYEDRGAK